MILAKAGSVEYLNSRLKPSLHGISLLNPTRRALSQLTISGCRSDPYFSLLLHLKACILEQFIIGTITLAGLRPAKCHRFRIHTPSILAFIPSQWNLWATQWPCSCWTAYNLRMTEPQKVIDFSFCVAGVLHYPYSLQPIKGSHVGKGATQAPDTSQQMNTQYTCLKWSLYQVNVHTMYNYGYH